MEVEKIQEKIKEVRDASKKRNFPQTFDIIVNLQALDLKKPEHKVDIGVRIATPIRPKKLKICAVVDHSIKDAEKIFDKVIYSEELQALKGDMKKIREVTHAYDKFVVQVQLMPVFAQILGRYLGPMNKMPSPKLGMVITDKTPLEDLYNKLQHTVVFQTKKNLVLQSAIGSETEKDEVIAQNIAAVYDALVHALPNQQNNIKNVGIKLTMGKLVEL